MDLLRTKKTAPAGARAVLMGPFREIRMKKTAPRGFKVKKRPRYIDLLRTVKDRASWSETVLMGPFSEIRMKKTALAGIMFLVQSSGDPAGNNALDGFFTPIWRGLF